MNKLERALLNAETGCDQPRFVLRTNTRVDTGRWLWHSKLWICMTADEVVVLAAARRHCIQRVPIADCLESHYCHTTGELVIEPAQDLRFGRLAMSPVDGIRVLDAIQGIEQS